MPGRRRPAGRASTSPRTAAKGAAAAVRAVLLALPVLLVLLLLLGRRVKRQEQRVLKLQGSGSAGLGWAGDVHCWPGGGSHACSCVQPDGNGRRQSAAHRGLRAWSCRGIQ